MNEQPVIVCADDDPDILALLTLRLERAGYKVAQAHDGAGALELARELEPDLVVLDVMMPRMNGTEVLAALRADDATKHLRVILISARAQDDDVRKGLEAGADAYLSKPFQAPELIQLVQRMLGSS